MFGEGMRVEVSRDKEHYGAVWFAGTVLKVIGKIYFLVEYENLRVNGNNHTEILLKEIVDIQYIRPCPPSFESTSFNVLDEVEGFHRDGWCAGIVSTILSGSRYMVNYKHQKEEVVLDRASMRPCLVWIDGHWVHSSQVLVYFLAFLSLVFNFITYHMYVDLHIGCYPILWGHLYLFFIR